MKIEKTARSNHIVHHVKHVSLLHPKVLDSKEINHEILKEKVDKETIEWI